MQQENHEAHDPEIKLSQEDAKKVAELIEDNDADGDFDSLAEVFDDFAEDNNSNDGVITAEEAKAAADFLRDKVDVEGEHKGLMTRLDSVAQQHGLSGPHEGGEPIGGNSDDD